MKPKAWPVFFLAFLFSPGKGVLAQEGPPNHQIIYYYDGSVFIGSIVEEDALRIKLLVATGDTISIHRSLIKKWLREKENISMRERGKFHYTKGVFASFDLGSDFSDYPSSQFDFILGRRINEKLSLGAGFGFHFNSTEFNSIWISNSFVPFYTYARRYLGKGKAGPFLFTKLGYSVPLHDDFFGEDYSGGFLAQPGFGLHFASRGKFRFILSLSEYIQHSKGSQSSRDSFNNPVEVKYSIWYTRLILKLGIEFR